MALARVGWGWLHADLLRTVCGPRADHLPVERETAQAIRRAGRELPTPDTGPRQRPTEEVPAVSQTIPLSPSGQRALAAQMVHTATRHPLIVTAGSAMLLVDLLDA